MAESGLTKNSGGFNGPGNAAGMASELPCRHGLADIGLRCAASWSWASRAVGAAKAEYGRLPLWVDLELVAEPGGRGGLEVGNGAVPLELDSELRDPLSFAGLKRSPSWFRWLNMVSKS